MTLTLVVRLAVVLGGLAALVLLFLSKKERWTGWTEKTRDLWVVIFLFVIGAVEANVEYLYRGTSFTAGTLIFIAAFVLLIRALRRKGGYTKDE